MRLLAGYKAIIFDFNGVIADATGRRAIEDTVSFIRANSKKFKLAIVSGCRRQVILEFLRDQQLIRCIKVLVAVEDYDKYKPDPAGYLLALEKLGERAPQVLAVEDTPRGISAAKAARLDCLGLVGTYQRQELSDADRTLDSLLELNL